MVCILDAIFIKANIFLNPRVIHVEKLLVIYVFHEEDHVRDVVTILTVIYHLIYIATCNRDLKKSVSTNNCDNIIICFTLLDIKSVHRFGTD